MNFTNPESRYKLVLQGKDVHVLRITFIADISINQVVTSVSKATKYHKAMESQSIAESVHFDLPVNDGKIDFAIHKINDGDSGIIAVTTKKS